MVADTAHAAYHPNMCFKKWTGQGCLTSFMKYFGLNISQMVINNKENMRAASDGATNAIRTNKCRHHKVYHRQAKNYLKRRRQGNNFQEILFKSPQTRSTVYQDIFNVSVG